MHTNKRDEIMGINDNEKYKFKEYNFAYTFLWRNNFVFVFYLNCKNLCCLLHIKKIKYKTIHIIDYVFIMKVGNRNCEF